MDLRRQQFGIDDNAMRTRLAYIGLSKADHPVAQVLHISVIAPNVDRIIDRFYDALLVRPESRKWLLDGDIIHSLKQTQRRYLLNFGVNFDSADYFEERLRIGVVHAAIGLPLDTYQGAFNLLLQLILDEIPEPIRTDPATYTGLFRFILKISSLDLTLATHAYHASSTDELKDEISLGRLREESLKAQAETDSLTQLPNRKHLFTLLNAAITDAENHDQPFCLLMVDIDRFKSINDRYGHPIGDQVIQQVAQTIAHAKRAQDIAGRYGGEEFAVGLVGVTPQAAIEVAERIRQRVTETEIEAGDATLSVTVSGGGAMRRCGETLVNLLKRSDEALYGAKGAGRDRIIFHDV